MAIWQRAAEALLPYTAARFETLELGPNAAGGLAIGHFLAARAMSADLAAERDAGRNTPASRASRVGHTLDALRTPEIGMRAGRGG